MCIRDRNYLWEKLRLRRASISLFETFLKANAKKPIAEQRQKFVRYYDDQLRERTMLLRDNIRLLDIIHAITFAENESFAQKLRDEAKELIRDKERRFRGLFIREIAEEHKYDNKKKVRSNGINLREAFELSGDEDEETSPVREPLVGEAPDEETKIKEPMNDQDILAIEEKLKRFMRA
eukprot:TRINITY_DN13161_c0_g1_i1.p1 TRINITY_DN13161_c0_g1~~TRINITY_DN13161_c0_g1_i1.p1  ORF type:complete len:179 (-),score=43.50 TRINITY_DN13161_c0_g1_i1:90-626(-)